MNPMVTDQRDVYGGTENAPPPEMARISSRPTREMAEQTILHQFGGANAMGPPMMYHPSGFMQPRLHPAQDGNYGYVHGAPPMYHPSDDIPHQQMYS